MVPLFGLFSPHSGSIKDPTGYQELPGSGSFFVPPQRKIFLFLGVASGFIPSVPGEATMVFMSTSLQGFPELREAAFFSPEGVTCEDRFIFFFLVPPGWQKRTFFCLPLS